MLQYFAVSKETSTVINAQTAAVVDVSGFAQVLETQGITTVIDTSYTIITENTHTIRTLDSAISIVVSGLVSAIDNENFAESVMSTFESTVASDIGKFHIENILPMFPFDGN